MGGNVLYTPALQAPVFLVNPAGQITLASDAVFGAGKAVLTPQQAAVLLSGNGSRYDIRIPIGTGADALSGGVPQVISALVTPKNPSIAALISQGMPASIAISNVVRNAVKWHPGWGMSSNTILGFNNSHLTDVLSEIAVLLDPAQSSSAAVHYRLLMMWGCWSTGPGAYNTGPGSALWQIYTKITGIASPSDYPSKWTGKRLSIMMAAARAGSGSGKDVVPQDIYNDPATYGAAPSGLPGAGYWSNTAMQVPNFTACLHRQKVMDRYLQDYAALANTTLPSGFTLDNDPYIEVVLFPETTAFTVTPSAPDYSFNLLDSVMKAAVPNFVAPFKHTNFAFQNNYWGSAASTCSLNTPIFAARGGISSPDCFGLTSVKNLAGFGTGYGIDGTITWGYRGYIGSTLANTHVAGENSSQYDPIPTGIPDSRGAVPAFVDVQSPELQGYQFQGYGSPWQPSDIGDNADQTLWAAIVWMCYVSGTGAVQLDARFRNVSAAPGNWKDQVMPYFNSHQLSHTAAPTNYPAVITT